MTHEAPELRPPRSHADYRWTQPKPLAFIEVLARRGKATLPTQGDASEEARRRFRGSKVTVFSTKVTVPAATLSLMPGKLAERRIFLLDSVNSVNTSATTAKKEGRPGKGAPLDLGVPGVSRGCRREQSVRRPAGARVPWRPNSTRWRHASA